MVRKLIPEAEVFVAEENEEIQGFIGLTDTYIAGIFVKTMEQSKGIGTELLRTVMKLKDHLKLNVYMKNMRINRMLKITTPCFVEGGWIPDHNAGFGEDKSPEFHIEGIDAEAETMVVTLDDLGHPLQPGYNHWVAWNITPAECIPGGITKGSIVENPIHIEQGIAYGKHCYRGPKPPFNWNHEYLFTLYTLDCMLEANEKSKKEDILKLAEGHILQKAELRGRYQRKHR